MTIHLEVSRVQRSRSARPTASTGAGIRVLARPAPVPWPIYAIGADSGEHAAFALVQLDAEGLRLLRLWPVYGTGVLWFERAREAADCGWASLRESVAIQQPADMVEARAARCRVWIETPPSMSRKLATGKRHTQASWIGLGRRVGALQMAWYCAARHPASLVEPSTWWMPWAGHGLKRGKDEATAGWHRVEEASALVMGAGAALTAVPKTRAVDCAESILIAGAAARDEAGMWAPPPPRRPTTLGLTRREG